MNTYTTQLVLLKHQTSYYTAIKMYDVQYDKKKQQSEPAKNLRQASFKSSDVDNAAR